MPGKPPNMELPEIPPAKGMSLRDWFAGNALIGADVFAYDDEWADEYFADAARRAYKLADAMLAERGEHE